MKKGKGSCGACGGPLHGGKCYGCGGVRVEYDLPIGANDKGPGVAGPVLEPSVGKSKSVGRVVTGTLVQNEETGLWEEVDACDDE
jgi:hypothetical protein